MKTLLLTTLLTASIFSGLTGAIADANYKDRHGYDLRSLSPPTTTSPPNPLVFSNYPPQSSPWTTGDPRALDITIPRSVGGSLTDILSTPTN